MMKKSTFLLLSALMLTACAKDAPTKDNATTATKEQPAQSATATAPSPTTTDTPSPARPAITNESYDPAELLGKDDNKDGIRDEVEAYIETLEMSDLQRESARYTAKVLQDTVLIDLTDDAALQKSSEQLMGSIGCMALRFSSPDDTESLIESLDVETFNTPERFDAYMNYNAAQDGSIAPEVTGNPCDAATI